MILKKGFTLIELLIVVAIIAILAAIAVPNFLEAQTRSKVSRVYSDIHSVTVAIEAYAVDNNNYPPGYKTAALHSLYALTTPVAFMSSGFIIDPFSKMTPNITSNCLTYELVNTQNRIIEATTGPYTINPVAGEQPSKGAWWWLASRGPDKQYGFKPSEKEYNLYEKFYNSDINPGGFISTIYDPTNGTVSLGNLYGSGGSVTNTAGRMMGKK